MNSNTPQKKVLDRKLLHLNNLNHVNNLNRLPAYQKFFSTKVPLYFMKQLSLEKRSRILDLIFGGNTYRETAKKENRSIGTISNIYEEFIEAATSSSIEKAGEKYGISDTIERLRELATEARKSKVSIKKLLSAARLYRFIQARNLKPSQLKRYLRMMDKHQINFEDFASKAIEFFEIEERTGKPYEKLVKDYPKLASKCQKLQNNIAELEKETKRARKSLWRELKNNNLIRSEIPYASMLKKTLIVHNFTVQETSKIPKLLREIEECKGDPRVLLERTEKTVTLNSEIHGLERKKGRLVTNVEDLDIQKRILEEEVAELSTTKTKLVIGINKLQRKRDAQDIECREKDIYLNIVNCLTDILLNKPADVANLNMYAKMLKEIIDKSEPSSIHLKPKYTEEVRKVLVQAFTEHFSNDLAPKEETIKLQEELNNTRQKNEELTKLNEELKQHNEELTKKIKKLEKQVKTLMEEARKNDESKLADLSIKPSNRKPPFPVY